MKKIVLFVAALVTLFIFSGISQAAEKNAAKPVAAKPVAAKPEAAKSEGPKTIVGVWSVIGTEGADKGKERAQIEIYEKNGVYEGKYVKLPLNTPGEKCNACTGDKKDQPLMGMVMIYGMKKTGDNKYADGKIYKTEAGKEYKCKLSLVDPNKLKVQGCIAFLCESQYWNRIK